MSHLELSDQEAFAFLGKLFPNGLKDEAVITELCPDGWEKSPLFACYHPAPEVMYEEQRAFSRNLRRLFPRKQEPAAETETIPSEEPEPTLANFLAQQPPQDVTLPPGASINKPAELLGLCLWDVFSDNHDVIDADGRVVHLGSFRGSAGTISDFFHAPPHPKRSGEDWSRDRGEGYLDFYMGTLGIGRRADLTPAYKLIFRRLKALGADWRYSFPRIYLVDLGNGEADDDSLPYDPSTALQREEDRKKRAAETARMRRELDRDVRSAMREARTDPPPATVRAYQEVYGKFPQGWPPDFYDQAAD